MDISSRARLPLVTLAFAAALLAALTGASNHAPDDNRTTAGGQLAASSAQDRPSPKATSTKRAGATTTSLAPPVTMAVQAPGQTTTTGVTSPEQAAEAEAAAAAAAEEPDTTAAADPEPVRSRTTAPPATDPPPPEPVPVGLTRLPNVELEVLTLTNIDRGNNGVPPIYRNDCLDAEASAWAHAMAESTVMAHSAGGGAAVQGCRGANAYWGDNIGYWQPCLASEMETWWMNSPDHRPHILSANFTVVGIGVWAEPNGRCWFQVYFGS